MRETVPFRIDVPDAVIDGIMRKVRAYRWHEMPESPAGGDPWAYGADMGYLKEFVAYWSNEFDWRRAEENLNRFPQFKARIDDLDIHFIHVRGSGREPLPILLTHGWPGSVFEFYEAIEPLAHPERFGGDAEDGLDLVIPSLPGYGFSGKPARPLGPRATAGIWDRLMRDLLGYPSYLAQGGDWGASVSGFLALEHDLARGGGCEALHINMHGLRIPASPETEEERAWAQRMREVLARESAYMHLQSTKPQTLSYAMMDSPVGAAAWMLEKFHSWSDRRGPSGAEHIEHAFSKDKLLTNIMIYLVTGSFNTATWFYRGFLDEGRPGIPKGRRVEAPTAIANYPREFISFPPRSMVEKGYNIVRWTDFERGGHFAALETGMNFAEDLRAFARQIRS